MSEDEEYVSRVGAGQYARYDWKAAALTWFGQRAESFGVWVFTDNAQKLDRMSWFVQALGSYVFIQVGFYFISERMESVDRFTAVFLSLLDLSMLVFQILLGFRIAAVVGSFFLGWMKPPTDLPREVQEIFAWSIRVVLYLAVVVVLNIFNYQVTHSLAELAKSQLPAKSSPEKSVPSRPFIPSCSKDHCVA